MIPRLVGASLRRRPRQLALIVAAVLVAAATVATLAAFSARAGQRLSEGLASFGPNLVVRPQVGGPADLSPAVAPIVGRVPGVESVKTVVAAAGDRPLGSVVGAVVRLEVRAQPARLAEVAKAIEARVEGVEASPLLKASESDARLIHRLRLVLAAVSGMSLLLALLSVGASTAALVGERRVEVGLMLALGLSGRKVGSLFAAELLTAALAAALLGELVGEFAAGYLERRLLGIGGHLTMTWTGMAASAAVAGLVVGSSLIVALHRIERVDPARVLRGE